MKKALLFIPLLLCCFAVKTATAQVRVKVNIRIQPVWGPVGYDHVEYYYMPDIDVFYNVPNRQYIYQDHGRWRFANSLPRRYHGFDIYNSYKVVINDDQRPYRNADAYRKKYGQYKGRHDQPIIRNSDDPKYFEIKDHPKHKEWYKDHNQGKGNNRKNS